MLKKLLDFMEMQRAKSAELLNAWLVAGDEVFSADNKSLTCQWACSYTTESETLGLLLWLMHYSSESVREFA